MIQHNLIVIVDAVTLFLIFETTNGLENKILGSCYRQFNLITRVIFIGTLFLGFQKAAGIHVQKLDFITVFDEVSPSYIKNLLVLELFIL